VAKSGVAGRFAAELRIAATTTGTTQRFIATKAGLAQSEVSRIITGRRIPDIGVAEALARATGHRLMIKLVPAEGVRLRDAGQLELAAAIRSQSHARWRIGLEVPVGSSPDLRAADMVLDQPNEVLHIEIERWLRDFQAQIRRAQLKRVALAERLERPVRLVVAVRDSATTRRIVGDHLDLVRAAFPVGTRRAWAAIRAGEPLGGDAMIWVRPNVVRPPA
jgi:transcriptional regulator with XRE-family HTH domain